jgi:hypothetical protein
MAKEVVFKFKVEVDGKEVEQTISSIDGFQKRISDLQTKLNSAPLGSKQFQELQKELKKTEGAFDAAKSKNQSFLDNLSEAPGILGNLGQSVQGVQKFFGNFNNILKASPLGLLAVVVTKVIQKFSEFGEVMDPLEKITKSFSGVINVLAKTILPPIEMILVGIANAAQKVANFFGELITGSEGLGDAIDYLDNGFRELEDSQAAFELAQSKSNRALQEAKEIIGDTTKPLEERKKALLDAEKLERQIAAEGRSRALQKAKLQAIEIATELGLSKEKIEGLKKANQQELENFATTAQELKGLNQEKLNALYGTIGQVEDIAAREAQIGKKTASSLKALDNEEKQRLEAKRKEAADAAKQRRADQIVDYDAQIKLLLTFQKDVVNNDVKYYEELRAKLQDFYKKRNQLEDKDKKLTASQLKQRQIDQKKAIDDGIKSLLDASDKTRQLDEEVIKSADAVAKAKQKQTSDIIAATIQLQKEQDIQYEKDTERLTNSIEISKKLYGEDSEQYKQAIIAKNKLDEAYIKNTESNNKKIEEGQKARNERIQNLDKALQDQQISTLTDNLQKQLETIEKDGKNKVEAYKKQLQQSLEAGDITLQQFNEKLVAFSASVAQGVEEATNKAVGEDFLTKLQAGVDAALDNGQGSYFRIVSTITDAQAKLDEAFKKGQITQDQYTKNSLDNEAKLQAAKQRTIGAINAAAGATLQLAEAFGEESAAGKVLIKVNQALALTSTALALAESLKGLGKDIGKGFPTNIIAVTSTLALIATAFTQAKALFGKAKATEETSAPQEPRRLASGGIVSGPGTGTSDSIPARLSNGESVINANSTRMFTPLLSAINQIGGGQAFQFGGIVSSSDMNLQEQNQSLISALSGQEPQPIKTYVVATDMTSQQMFDRAQKSRSTL